MLCHACNLGTAYYWVENDYIEVWHVAKILTDMKDENNAEIIHAFCRRMITCSHSVKNL